MENPRSGIVDPEISTSAGVEVAIRTYLFQRWANTATGRRSRPNHPFPEDLVQRSVAVQELPGGVTAASATLSAPRRITPKVGRCRQRKTRQRPSRVVRCFSEKAAAYAFVPSCRSDQVDDIVDVAPCAPFEVVQRSARARRRRRARRFRVGGGHMALCHGSKAQPSRESAWANCPGKDRSHAKQVRLVAVEGGRGFERPGRSSTPSGASTPPARSSPSLRLLRQPAAGASARARRIWRRLYGWKVVVTGRRSGIPSRLLLSPSPLCAMDLGYLPVFSFCLPRMCESPRNRPFRQWRL